jgi:hypothetical protein
MSRQCQSLSKRGNPKVPVATGSNEESATNRVFVQYAKDRDRKNCNGILLNPCSPSPSPTLSGDASR